MVRPFADALTDTLLQAFPADTSYTRADLDRAPMPAQVAHFLKESPQHRLDASVERTRSVHGAWVDHTHPEVERAERAYAAALVRHARIPGSEWPRVLRQAAARVTAYLVRPVETLLDFVFEDAPGALPVSEVLRRLACFEAYPYFREVLEAYAVEKGVDEVERARLAALLPRIDRHMTADYGAAQWMTLAEPLYTLARVVDARGEVPLPLLVAFFEARQAHELARRLQQAGDGHGRAGVDAATLRFLLEEPRVTSPTAAPADRGARPAPASSADDEAEAVPLWKQFQRQQTPPAPHLAAADAGAAEAAGVPLWMRYRTEAAAEDEAQPKGGGEANALEALEAAVLGHAAAGRRPLFVRQLFGGSAAAYEEALRRLHALPTWDAASRYIAHDVFQRYQVDLFSEAAVFFTDAVEAGYRR